METHSNTLAWKIPWTEEPGRLQSMGSQRVRHDWVTSLSFSFLSKLKVVCFFLNYITWGGEQVFLYLCDRTEGTRYPLDFRLPGPVSHLRENWQGVREEL